MSEIRLISSCISNSSAISLLFLEFVCYILSLLFLLTVHCLLDQKCRQYHGYANIWNHRLSFDTVWHIRLFFIVYYYYCAVVTCLLGIRKFSSFPGSCLLLLRRIPNFSNRSHIHSCSYILQVHFTFVQLLDTIGICTLNLCLIKTIFLYLTSCPFLIDVIFFFWCMDL